MTERRSNSDPEAFRQQRLAMLTGPGGSLSMVAMPTITASPQTFEGLPGMWSCPHPAAGVSVAATADDLQIDGHQLVGTALLSPASRLRFSATVTAQVAQEVDGTWFLQVADTESPHLAAFDGLETYDVDPDWVLQAHYRSRTEAERPTLAGRLGGDDQHTRNCPGDVEFTLDNHMHRLAVYASFIPGWFTINFTDETSGSQTPSAGRILALPLNSDGPVVLDFNQAMLLPHESSSVYPCPTPPAGNHLPIAVTAGERALRFRH